MTRVAWRVFFGRGYFPVLVRAFMRPKVELTKNIDCFLQLEVHGACPVFLGNDSTTDSSDRPSSKEHGFWILLQLLPHFLSGTKLLPPDSYQQATMSIPLAPADLPERFHALKRQEEAYEVLDYLNPACCPESACAGLDGHTKTRTSRQRQGTLHLTECPTANIVADTSHQNNDCFGVGVNEEWRTKICEWSYQVIDHFDYDREIVAISLNYIDRYLSKRHVNKRTFQLVAMTTLYLACKLYGPKKLRISSLLELSRGYFTEEHIKAMEMSILNELGWLVHPPTPLTFARNYVLVLKPTACEPVVWHSIMTITKFLTELSVVDYNFAPFKASSVGLAALLTAMEGISNGHLGVAEKQSFAINVYRVAKVSPNDHEVMTCRERLRELFYEGGFFEQLIPAEAALVTQENRERSLATKRITNESPDAVDAHPIMLDEDDASHGTSSPIPVKNENGSSRPNVAQDASSQAGPISNATLACTATKSAASSPTDVCTVIAIEADKVAVPWPTANEAKKRQRRMS